MIVYKERIDSQELPVFKINIMALEHVQSYNYLGVIVDDILSFEKFVEDKYNKTNFQIYQLSKIRKYITASIAEVIYKQIILLMDWILQACMRSMVYNRWSCIDVNIIVVKCIG